MAKPAYDCDYLKETVGTALARGCAATVTAEPNDPVDYLGRWIMRYVENAQVEGNFYIERDAIAAQQKEAEVEAEKAAKLVEEAKAERQAALQALADSSADPFVLFQEAVALIEKYTDASAAYTAVIERPDEPAGELIEEEPESEDEEAPPEPPPEEGEEPEEEPEPEPAEEEVEKPDPNIVKFNYSDCFLRYVAATEADKPTIQRIGVLTRPVPPPEDEEPPEGEEAPKALPLPPTFDMLDEQVPSMFIPNVADNPSVRFFKRFPRMGSYFAAAVQSLEDEFKALLCADTIVPSGSGKAFSQEDRDFIWDVSRAVTKALTLRDSARKADKEAKPTEFKIAALAAKVTATLYPPPPEPVEGEAPPAPEDTPPEGEEEDEDAEVEEEEPGEEEDDIGRCQRELRNLDKHLSKAEKKWKKAVAATQIRQEVLSIWRGQIKEDAQTAVDELKQMTHAPQATFHVIKAVNYLLKDPPDVMESWAKARTALTVEFFGRVADMDAEAERDMGLWNKARAELKAVVDEKLAEECPKSNIGTLLRKAVRAVRATANKAVVMRELEAGKTQREEEIKAKQEELEAEEKRKEEEEAAAAAAAEAEAAAAAAEGEEGGEEAGEEA